MSDRTESDSSSKNPSLEKSPSRPPRSVWKKLWIGFVLVVVVGLAGLGASIYYFGHPVAIPALQHPLANRVTELEQAMEAQSGQMDQRIATNLAQALEGDRQFVSITDWTSLVEEVARLEELIQSQADDVANVTQELEGQMGQVEALAQQTSQRQSDVDDLEAAIGVLGEQVTQLQRAVESTELPITAPEVLALAKEQSALILAHWALSVAAVHIAQGQKEMALAQYQTAQAALANTDSASFGAVRASLSTEQELLELWPAVPWQAWIERVAEWDIEVGSDVGDASMPSSNAASRSEEQSTWTRIRQTLGQLVRVRQRDLDALSDGEHALVRASIHQRWLLLELALHRQDVEASKQYAKELADLFAKISDGSGEEVALPLRLVNELMRLEPTPPPVEIGKTKQMTEQLLQINP